MNRRRSSFGLSAVLIFVLLSCGDCEPFKIVKRPGRNPLKCFKKGDASKCVEVTPEEAGVGGGPVEDPHDVEKGPLGGKIYRVGGSTMECFPNGQCFPVNEKAMKTTPIPTTLAPTTLAPTTLAPNVDSGTVTDPHDEEKGPLGGKIYRMGSVIMECLNGHCFPVDEKDMEAITAPTTLAPTTLAPTTLAPTTLAPTTLAPTTLTNTLVPFVGSGENKDSHDIEKGPSGGKIYRIGGLTMECFPSGDCLPVKDVETTLAPTTLAPTTLAPTTLAPTTLAPSTLAPTTFAPTTLEPTTLAPTTLAPTTLAPTTLEPTTLAPTTPEPTTPEPTTLAPTSPEPEKSGGKFFRRGNEIVECFRTGKCNVVAVVNPDTETNSENEEHGDNGKKDKDGDKGHHCEDEFSENKGKNDEDGDNGSHDENSENGDNGANDDNGNDEAHDDSGKKGYWDYIDYDYEDDYENELDIEDIKNDTVGDYTTNKEEPGSSGKAVCTFQNSAAVQGSIILVEEHAQSPMEVIGRLHGLKEGIHVLTFHQTGEVESAGCRGVGGYHRPSENKTHFVHKRSPLLGRRRRRRQTELFRMGEQYMDDAYAICLRHLAACQEDQLTSPTCETYLEKCVPILKCKRCKGRVEAAAIFDTIGDLERSGTFNFKSEMPRDSLFVYADDQGHSNFVETEREQSLHGPDSVLHRSIVLSVLPKNSKEDFVSIACCRIENAGPMMIV